MNIMQKCKTNIIENCLVSIVIVSTTQKIVISSQKKKCSRVLKNCLNKFCEVVKCFLWKFWHLNKSSIFKTNVYPFWQWLETLKVKNNTPFALFQQLFVSVFGQMWQKRYFNLNHKSSCLRTSFLKFFKLSWVHAIALLEDFVDEEQNCIGRNSKKKIEVQDSSKYVLKIKVGILNI